jgi:hypothetical protein
MLDFGKLSWSVGRPERTIDSILVDLDRLHHAQLLVVHHVA